MQTSTHTLWSKNNIWCKFLLTLLLAKSKTPKLVLCLCSRASSSSISAELSPCCGVCLNHYYASLTPVGWRAAHRAGSEGSYTAYLKKASSTIGRLFLFIFTSPGCIQLFYAEAASVSFPGRAPVAHRTEARAKPRQGQGWLRLQRLPSQQKTLCPWHLSCQASAEQPHAHAPRITSKRRAIERPQEKQQPSDGCRADSQPGKLSLSQGLQG